MMGTATTAVLSAQACSRPRCVCHDSERDGHGLTHCVAHDDANPSMNVSEKDGKILLRCHSGCSQESVWNALRSRDLLEPVPSLENFADRITATYDYTDLAGQVLFQVVRLRDPKSFRQRTPDGRWGLNGTKPVLYRLPDIALALRMGETVYVVEGEKDADALRAKGLIATTSPMGAGKWRPEYSEYLRGAHVVIVQDKDEPGYRHAADVAASLKGVAASVRIVEAITGKDAFDHLAAGHGVDDFAPAKPFGEQPAQQHWQLGGPFILDVPEEIPCLWGKGDEIVMAEGESLFIVGPSGVGKSTLCQQLLLAFAGLRNDVLGYPVQPAEGAILYLAMDRPQQIRRSLRRMVIEEDRAVLDAKLRFWPGPLHFNALEKPEDLLELCRGIGATHLFVDSLKDLAISLAKDEVAAQLNRLFQFLSAAGIELVVLHHQRKAQGDNKKPTTLADVYGNFQITAGAGSVILLWGEPGDAVITLDHLKQPRSPIGPLNLVHNHSIGFTEVEDAPADALEILRSQRLGLVAEGIAREMFGAENPSKAQVERARRRAEDLAQRGLVYSVNEPSAINKRRPIVRYFAVDTRHEEAF